MFKYLVECTDLSSGNRWFLLGEYETKEEAETRRINAKDKEMFNWCWLMVVKQEVNN